MPSQADRIRCRGAHCLIVRDLLAEAAEVQADNRLMLVYAVNRSISQSMACSFRSCNISSRGSFSLSYTYRTKLLKLWAPLRSACSALGAIKILLS